MAAAHHSQDVRVLVVDDEASVRDVVAASLQASDDIHVVGTASNGLEAVQLARSLQPDVVVMDVLMPGGDGCEACRAICEASPETSIVALTGATASQHITNMILAGAVGYAIKGADPDILCQIVLNARNAGRFIDSAAVPGLFDSVVALAREERERREEAERLARDLKRSYQESVRALMQALRSRDQHTGAHGDRVARRVQEVGRRLALTDAQLVDLEYGAVFHDIGKIGIPDSILHNTDELTPEEWVIIKQHTVVGEQIIQPIGFLKGVSRIVRHTHEHWDGSGYPDGLVGDQIPIESRIIFSCDAFDAMTTERTYQAALDRPAACARMQELSGSRFDPMVVQVLLAVLAEEDTHALAR